MVTNSFHNHFSIILHLFYKCIIITFHFIRGTSFSRFVKMTYLPRLEANVQGGGVVLVKVERVAWQGSCVHSSDVSGAFVATWWSP